MRLMNLVAALTLHAAVLAIVAIAEPASAASCTDGVDCFCDRMTGSDIIFCEDMEDRNLPVRNASDRNRSGSWMDKYGPSVSGCTVNAQDPQYYTPFGTTSQACVDIVNESTPTMSAGGCGVSGETDCVHDGNYALGFRMQQGRVGGIVGIAQFQKSRTFGYSMAIKWSSNYVSPGTAHKMNEFGDGNHGLIGVGTSGAGRNVPFSGFAWGPIPATYNVRIGNIVNNSGTINFNVDTSVYDFERLPGDGPGNWECLQVHWANWGRSNATMRVWLNEQLAAHVTNIDMSSLNYDPTGIGSMSWNHYFNDGYREPAVAYRYEDNVVVTNASEPVSCGVLGFGDSGGGTTPPPPAAPVLLD